uniref:Uncharacterized protein n=1 Tax=Cucumis melo TaxID=3656 RepID=A0A9I9E620_CUCME
MKKFRELPPPSKPKERNRKTSLNDTAINSYEIKLKESLRSLILPKAQGNKKDASLNQSDVHYYIYPS